MKVTQVTIGRFSQFNLARQLEKQGRLDCIWTGYPKFKLRDETGIPTDKIKTFPWVQVPYLLFKQIGLSKLGKLSDDWSWLAHETLDKHVASQLKEKTILLGLSGSGLHSGRKAKQLGGKYICHRGSSHISFQNDILIEEYKRWGLTFPGIDERKITKELGEYSESDIVVVPSEFAKQTFIKQGISEEKIKKVIYGARMDRFKKCGDPENDSFRLLWVGAVSIRKGFLDALHAFQKLRHSNKEFLVIGSIQKEMGELLKHENVANVKFVGTVPNIQLVDIYNQAHAFIISSIEDGFGVVMGEALACGCPVIASENTGSKDLFSHGVEGFIVPIRSPEIIHSHLEELAQDNEKRNKMGESGLKLIRKMRGWDEYGNSYIKVLDQIR